MNLPGAAHQFYEVGGDLAKTPEKIRSFFPHCAGLSIQNFQDLL